MSEEESHIEIIALLIMLPASADEMVRNATSCIALFLRSVAQCGRTLLSEPPSLPHAHLRAYLLQLDISHEVLFPVHLPQQVANRDTDIPKDGDRSPLLLP